MNTLLRTVEASWGVLVAMAPYLLLGFAVAGALSAAVNPSYVRRHLGQGGLWQVVKASLFGVPVPLCSCGVIPVGLSLRRAGATRGATVSFMASTPQTGVDSIAATVALLGPVLTVLRVAAAFVSGVAAGFLAELLERKVGPDRTASDPAADPTNGPTDGPPAPATPPAGPAWQRMLRFGLVTLPRDVARPLLAGVVVSGAITALVPEGFLAQRIPGGLLAYLGALAVGVPLYVCSMSSIPLAAGLIHMGVQPGAAMVFLISGPATNGATVAALWSRVGRRATFAYLVGISLTALAAGWILDAFFPAAFATVPPLEEHCLGGHGASLVSTLTAVVLLLLLLPGLLPERDSGDSNDDPAARAGPAGDAP
jgi:uncharacterized membrane protein YraQ (UPF0718 family)